MFEAVIVTVLSVDIPKTDAVAFPEEKADIRGCGWSR